MRLLHGFVCTLAGLWIFYSDMTPANSAPSSNAIMPILASSASSACQFYWPQGEIQVVINVVQW